MVFTQEIIECWRFQVLAVDRDSLNKELFDAQNKKKGAFYNTYYGCFYRAQITGLVNYMVKAGCLTDKLQLSLFSKQSYCISLIHDEEYSFRQYINSIKFDKKLIPKIEADVKIKSLSFVNSQKDYLIQLVDVLTGFLTYVAGFVNIQHGRDKLCEKYVEGGVLHKNHFSFGIFLAGKIKNIELNRCYRNKRSLLF